MTGQGVFYLEYHPRQTVDILGKANVAGPSKTFGPVRLPDNILQEIERPDQAGHTPQSDQRRTISFLYHGQTGTRPSHCPFQRKAQSGSAVFALWHSLSNRLFRCAYHSHGGYAHHMPTRPCLFHSGGYFSRLTISSKIVQTHIPPGWYPPLAEQLFTLTHMCCNSVARRDMNAPHRRVQQQIGMKNMQAL